MTRPLRIQYEGAVYHVTCRGNERKEIFKNDKDKETFLNFLRDSLATYNVVLYCYVLMNNHFHFLLETPLANLGEFMRQFNIRYTAYYNWRHKRVGHLYQGRYKSILVDGDSYLTTLSKYIHLNPIRIRNEQRSSLSEEKEYLKQYKWSSLLGYLDEREKKSFVNYSAVLEDYGGDNKTGRKKYWNAMEETLAADLNVKANIVGQSILGCTNFIEEIREKFLNKCEREIPSIKSIEGYATKETIIQTVCEEINRELKKILDEKGTMRNMLMEFLYRFGGLNGRQIGEIVGVDYTTVSRGRKKFKKKLLENKILAVQAERIEDKLLKRKNCQE